MRGSQGESPSPTALTPTRSVCRRRGEEARAEGRMKSRGGDDSNRGAVPRQRKRVRGMGDPEGGRRRGCPANQGRPVASLSIPAACPAPPAAATWWLFSASASQTRSMTGRCSRLFPIGTAILAAGRRGSFASARGVAGRESLISTLPTLAASDCSSAAVMEPTGRAQPTPAITRSLSMRIAVSGGRPEARAAGPPRERGAEGIASPSVRLGSSYPKVGLRLSTYLPAWCREDMAALKAARARLESGSESAGGGRAPGSAPLGSYQQLRAAGGG